MSDIDGNKHTNDILNYEILKNRVLCVYLGRLSYRIYCAVH